MIIEKSREDFEAAVKKDWPRANFNRCDVPGSLRSGQYVDECIQHAWWGWQASRAAVVVDLPSSPYIPDAEPAHMTPYEIGEAQGRCDMWAMSREAIIAAGLKVKP